MKKEVRKGRHIKNIMVLLAVFICLSISGCGDSGKSQVIMVYDYLDNTEKEYDYTNENIDDLVNQICDFFLDGESETYEIPSGALEYKRIDVFQTDKHKSVEQQKTDDNRLVNIEIYQYNNEFYCKACFSFSDQDYSAKLSSDISAQVEKLQTSR